MMKRKTLKKALIVLLLVAVLLSLVPVGVFAAENTPNFCNLILFVNFSDSSVDVFNLNTNREKINEMYNGTSSPDISFKNYIKEISNGRLLVNNYFPQDNGEDILTLKLSHPVSYYTSDYTLLAEVIDGITSGTYAVTLDTHANKLDNREAGVLDNLTLIFQYEALSRDDLLYPHKSVYGGSERIGGVVVRNYNIIDSANLISSTGEEYYAADKQGVIAHEFLHSVGLPDLYRYFDNGVPVGRWDIMAGVSYFMQYPLSYLRHLNGWIDMPKISEDGSYHLNAVTAKSGTVAYKIETPLSESEFFVVEYRVKNDDISGFECKIPSGGLLIYRVNTAVENQTNSQGENYIYVLRPEATDPNAANETFDVYYGNVPVNYSSTEKSAIDPDAGETAYGSNELDKSYTENTIYYSDGRNSGVSIENVAYSPDKSQITFDVSFADYESLDLWDNLGDGLNANASGSASIAYDSISGDVYSSYSNEIPSTFSSAVAVSVFRNNEWVSAIPNIADAQAPKIYAFKGNIYLSLIKNNSSFCLYRLDSGVANLIRTETLYPNYSGFFDDGNELYWYYVDDTQHLIVAKAVSGEVVSSSLSASYLTDPKIVCSNNEMYLIYSDPFAQPEASRNTQIAKYNPQSKAFDNIGTLDIASNTHAAVAYESKVYFLGGANNTNPIIAVYENGAFTTTSVSQMISYSNVKLCSDKEKVFIGYVDSSDNSAKVLSVEKNGFTQYGAYVGDSSESFDICVGVNTVYAATLNSSAGKVSVKYKQSETNIHTVTYLLDGNIYDAGDYGGSFHYNDNLTVAPKAVKQGYTVTDWVSSEVTVLNNGYIMPDCNVTFRASSELQENYRVALAIPNTFNTDKIYLDGVEFTAIYDSGRLTVNADSGRYKCACVYAYNNDGIPIGMRVFTLEYINHAYKINELTQLRDLLSYHGFSVRVAGVSGIRFKSGIDINKKTALASAEGLEGCRLVEYGTLVMKNSNRESCPFILNGEKVSSGKAYWTENGVLNDKVFETLGGRQRFTSVLVNLPTTQYKTDFAFRSYVKLVKGDSELIIYGPIVSRSIYTVSNQVLQSGSVAVGSSADIFLRNIIQTAR